MKYASVCSGVEAASLAWMPLGWDAAWFSEIEPFPCEVLKQRFPGVPNLGDMTKIKVENLENGDQRFTNGSRADVIVPGGVDLLVGGTPCQGFSIAGKKGGLQDDRSVLCLTFCKLLADMRPQWFVWENVPGVFSTGGGEDFKAFLGAIDEIGYHVAWRVLDAQYVRVDGFPRAVPQKRRRVFVIGHLGGWEYPAEVLFEPSSLSWDSPPCRIKGKGFTANAERSVGNASRDISEYTARYSSYGEIKLSDVAGTIKTNSSSCGNSSGNFVFWNGENVSTTLTEAFADDRMPDKGKLPCVVQSNTHGNEQIVCVHGSQDPCCNSDHANSVQLNNGLENVVCYAASGFGQKVKSDVSATISSDHDDRVTGNNAVLIQERIGYYPSQHQVPKESETPTLKTDNCSGIRGDTPLVQECYSVDRRNQSLDKEVSNTLNTCNGGDNYNTVMESIGFEPGIAKRDGSYSRFTEEFCGTIRSNMGDNQPAVAIAENIIGRKVENGGNGTGVQEELAYTQNASGVMGLANHATVRRLLPVECERLMGFPDNWTKIPWKGKSADECPDSPRYKACGNSMCVNVMRWIGMRINNVERKVKR